MEQTSQAKLYAALAQAQAGFEPIRKNREVTIRTRSGPSYSFKYADLESIIAATRTALAANGLAVFQRIESEDGKMSIGTVLCHADGGEVISKVPLEGKYEDIKTYGATISYLRRYAYSALLCIAADDDLDEDGSEAGDIAPPAAQSKPSKPTKPERKEWSAEDFAETLPKLLAGIQKGKSVDDALAWLKAKADVTLEQEAKLSEAARQETKTEEL